MRLEDAAKNHSLQNIGVSYTIDELRDVYENSRDELSGAYDERLKTGIEMLNAVNDKLAEEFKELVVLICEIIAASDDTMDDEEHDEIQALKNLLES